MLNVQRPASNSAAVVAGVSPAYQEPAADTAASTVWCGEVDLPAENAYYSASFPLVAVRWEVLAAM